MWKNGYSIFFFSFGAIYNASGVAIDEEIVNFFDTESQAWEVLHSLHGLNDKVTYTVLSCMKFV